MTTQSNKKGRQLGQVNAGLTRNDHPQSPVPPMERFGFLGMRRRPVTRTQDPKRTLVRKEEYVAGTK